MTTTAEPGIDLSLPSWTCWHGCGFEADGDDYNRHNEHLNWHTNQESRFTTMEQKIQKLEQDLQFERNNVQSLLYSINRVENVIGTEGDYRFVEKTPLP